jgi:hypothetical protein
MSDLVKIKLSSDLGEKKLSLKKMQNVTKMISPCSQKYFIEPVLQNFLLW